MNGTALGISMYHSYTPQYGGRQARPPPAQGSRASPGDPSYPPDQAGLAYKPLQVMSHNSQATRGAFRKFDGNVASLHEFSAAAPTKFVEKVIEIACTFGAIDIFMHQYNTVPFADASMSNQSLKERLEELTAQQAEAAELYNQSQTELSPEPRSQSSEDGQHPTPIAIPSFFRNMGPVGTGIAAIPESVEYDKTPTDQSEEAKLTGGAAGGSERSSATTPPSSDRDIKMMDVFTTSIWKPCGSKTRKCPRTWQG